MLKQSLARKSHGQLDDASKISADLHHYQLYDAEKEEIMRLAESQRTRPAREFVNKSQVINPSKIAATTSSKILLDNASHGGQPSAGRVQTPLSYLAHQSPSKASLASAQLNASHA